MLRFKAILLLLPIQFLLLLSFGLGISGKLSLIEAYSENRKRGLMFGIGARWTEFFLHNARNRQIDGFQ